MRVPATTAGSSENEAERQRYGTLRHHQQCLVGCREGRYSAAQSRGRSGNLASTPVCNTSTLRWIRERGKLMLEVADAAERLWLGRMQDEVHGR